MSDLNFELVNEFAIVLYRFSIYVGWFLWMRVRLSNELNSCQNQKKKLKQRKWYCWFSEIRLAFNDRHDFEYFQALKSIVVP